METEVSGNEKTSGLCGIEFAKKELKNQDISLDEGGMN